MGNQDEEPKMMAHRIPRLTQHLLAAAIAGSLAIAIGMAATPAGAASSFTVLLRQIDARIALSEAMVDEGERRALERINELRQWIAWWESVKALAQAKQTDLKKNIDQRQKNAALLLKTLRGMTTDPKQSRHVPNFGWHSVESATALAASLAQETRKLNQAITTGKDNWHIVVAGWITGGGIQGKIDGLTAQIAKIDKGVNDGSFNFHGPFGWQTIGHHRKQAEGARDELAQVKAQIAKGDFPLTIPGIGQVTRNQLEEKLAGVEAAIAKLKGIATAGDYQIHRDPVGFVTRNKLADMIEQGEASYQAMKAAVGDGLFTVHIAGIGGGWWTRQKLEAKVAAFDKTIADITTAIRSGDYKAQVFGGWQTLNALKNHLANLEKRLQNPNLSQVQRNQIAEEIEAVHKAVKEWRDMSAVDLVIKGLEKTKFLAWAGMVLKLAKPDFDHRTLIRDEQVRHMTSFDGELALRLRPLEAQRDSYLDGMKWFASE